MQSVTKRGGFNMLFKMTEEEMKVFYKSFKPCFDDCHTFGIMFAADHDFLTEVLPPGFEPTDDAISVSFTWGAKFTGTVVGIPAKFGDKKGSYGLTYMMDRDTAVIFGRELWGEPKKVAQQVMTKEGDEISISVKRFGVETVRAHGTIVQEADPKMFANTEALHTKYFISSDGSGLDDAKVVYNLFTNDVRCAYFCKATMDQTASKYDILGSLPVGEIKYAYYFESDMYPVGEDIGTIPGKDMMPYACQRHDFYNMGHDKFDK